MAVVTPAAHAASSEEDKELLISGSEAVCPVEHCITMVNESVFDDNASQWEMWRKDKDAYKTWMTSKIGDKNATVRSHGFRFRGQYEKELETNLDAGGVEITAGIPGENAQHKTV